MSDDFIPLNQSTPTGNKWQNQGRIHNRGIHVHYQHNQSNSSQYNHNQSGHRRGFHSRRGNNSYRNSSYGSDSNSSNYSQDGPPIDAYLHPSMLQDPWAQLRRKLESGNGT